MNNLETKTVYVGLSGLDFEGDVIDLGHGLVLRKTYAHLMAPFIVAFRPPGGAYGLHGGPWKTAAGGLAFDITVGLEVPPTLGATFTERIKSVAILIFLLRLTTTPAIRAPVISDNDFSQLRDGADDVGTVVPYEVEQRHISLSVKTKVFTTKDLWWMQNYWNSAIGLVSANPKLQLAMDAIDRGPFVSNQALTLVSVWSALEALFSPSSAELKYRVSTNIACYLSDPGNERVALRKKVSRLYDRRSSAAHGNPNFCTEDLVESFNILRNALIKILSTDRLPTYEELERIALGDTELEIILAKPKVQPLAGSG